VLKRFYDVPDVLTNYPLGDYFSIVMPEAVDNLVTNPSFELDTTGYTAVSSSIARVATWQRRGAYGLQITPNTGVASGVYFGTISLTAGQWYTFSIDFQGDAGKRYNLYFASTAGASLAIKSFVATGFKQRIWVNWYETSSTTRRLYLTRNAYADTNIFYTDGWQCENKDHPTTYTDGDLVGFTVGVKDYGWYGAPHASASWRNARTASGGKVIKLRDLGFTLMVILGLGMAPINNLALSSSSGGGFYQDTILGERQFTLLGSIQGTSFPDLQRIRKELINALKPDRIYPKQPLLLQYQAVDDCGNETSEIINIPCNLQEGLKGQVDNNFQERLGLQFQQFLPLVRGEGEEGAALGYQSVLTAVNYVIMRDKNGTWAKLGTGANGGIRAIAIGPDGKVYVGGVFTQMASVANTAYIAVWDPLTTTWSALSTGMDGPVVALVFDSIGNLYVGGIFAHAGAVSAANIAMWDGAWHAMGAGVDDEVLAIESGPDGLIYVGGVFHNAGGVAALHIATWDGANWATLAGGGVNNNVYALVFGPGNKLYVGGNFSTAGTVPITVNSIAMWDGAWHAMNDGVTPTSIVYTIVIGSDGSVYAVGSFTVAGNPAVTVNNIAEWNQVYWSDLAGGNLSGTLTHATIGPDNFLLVAGTIVSTIGGVAVTSNSAVWNNSSWASIDVQFPANPLIKTMVYDNAGNLYIGYTVAGTVTASIVTTITNHGSAEARPKIILTGPGAVYQLKSITTNKTISFNLTLLTGETATLDMEKNTFLSNFRGDLRYMILPGSANDFTLQSGANLISLFIGGTVDANTAAVMIWVDQFQGIDEAVR
jgi:hypothetical protein